jgi:hypothetical protein
VITRYVEYFADEPLATLIDGLDDLSPARQRFSFEGD